MLAKVCTLSRKELALEIRLRLAGKAGEFDIPLFTLIDDHRRRKDSDAYWKKRNPDGTPKPAEYDETNW